MKSKEPGAIRQLFMFVGSSKGKMKFSILMAVLGELFGMVPFLMLAMLADSLYFGTATTKDTVILAGIAALCQCIKTFLIWRSSLLSHRISFTILQNIRERIADKMAKVPMGVMLETPSGSFKNLIVDNVAKLEDSMAHFMPELPSHITAPLCSILLIFGLAYGAGLFNYCPVGRFVFRCHDARICLPYGKLYVFCE
jgi:ATP-binding cassette subfamily B protein IrtA